MDHHFRTLCGIGLLIVSLFAPLSVNAQAENGPVGYVIIPALDLYHPVYFVPIIDHAYSEDALIRRVGWLQGTSWIHDDWGRVVLAGHSYGVFTDLNLLRAGDRVIVGDSAGAVVYRVTGWQIVGVDDTTWLQPTSEPTLLLITCSDANRLVVYAEKEN